MAMQRVVVTALINGDGAVLLRLHDEQSVLRANWWSLLGGGVDRDEAPADAAVRHVAQQTGLRMREPRLMWTGLLPSQEAAVYFYVSATRAVLSEVRQTPGYVLEFVPVADVLSGRSFSPVSGYVLGRFAHELSSYDSPPEPSELA